MPHYYNATLMDREHELHPHTLHTIVVDSQSTEIPAEIAEMCDLYIILAEAKRRLGDRHDRYVVIVRCLDRRYCTYTDVYMSSLRAKKHAHMVGRGVVQLVKTYLLE